jgi:hypothetical protein
MTDTRRLIERVGERAPFPSDAFERMLRRRDRKQRNQRLAAAGVGIAVFVAMVAFALGAIDRSEPVPRHVPPAPGEVTFWGTDGVPISVNGVPIKGQMANTPEEVYLYRFSPTVGVPAGAQIVVGDARTPAVNRGWIDSWWDGSTPSERLYELDLDNNPTMPTEPGSYTVEFAVPDPDDANAVFTLLFPVRVVAPEEMGLALSFDPYAVNRMVWVNGVPLPGEMDGGQFTEPLQAFYIFAPNRPIELAAGASITVEGANVLDDVADVPHVWIDACCDTSTAPSRLSALELGGSAVMPAEPGKYFLEIRWTCETCEPDAGIAFLFPVRVVAPKA